ncbi:MAG: hypothetical protein K8823_526 [Cenarchaeum symbiont of Oopsacas minuta]|nr:hypothetical protein [Cenarchaeum symbiont of Oopsacas minuta]
MALPMESSDGYDESEHTDNVDNYRITCISFIEDLSLDYLAWVDRYDLPNDEDARRRSEIAATIEKTNHWIAKIAQSIKAVDVVMNDGIQKMAEATAGRPFDIGVFVNGVAGYTTANPGNIKVMVKASSKKDRKTKLGFHFQDTRFRIESTASATLTAPKECESEYELLDLMLNLDASLCVQRDLVSFTITVSETKDGQEFDKRGLSTIVHLI